MAIIDLPTKYLKELPPDSFLLESEKKHAEWRNKKPTPEMLEIIDQLKREREAKANGNL